jgi:hypothetical protein
MRIYLSAGILYEVLRPVNVFERGNGGRAEFQVD